MTTLHNEELEALRDDFCCEYGKVFAEKAAGLYDQEEPNDLQHVGLQEEYFL
ncbi:hypothetical protein LOZ80_28490 [Paenibacillus sp. HWE-109]|uniref:hypothetical protein n=1 Tax=Paenibacillus sp. HWE-109 TaxID=1306526 RepID=UPI001EDCEA19|nr:hypothetical protein [Paenibacillus sp. HWE-109]UKS25496.1 hypothetical protein LOZ80_28490 [Paenibacillus sp. HWE-109]